MMTKILICALLSTMLVAGASSKPKPTKAKAPTQDTEKSKDQKAKGLIEEAKNLLEKKDYVNSEVKAREAFTIATPESEEEAAAKKLLETSLSLYASTQLPIIKGQIKGQEYSRALETISPLLERALPESPLQKYLDTLQQDTISSQRQMAMLNEAKNKIDDGAYDQATTAIEEVLKEAKDPNVVRAAKDVLAKTHGTFPQSFSRIFNHFNPAVWIILDVVFVGIFLYLAYLALCLGRRKYTNKHKDEWLVFEIDDKSDMALGGVIANSLRDWSQKRPPVSAGLLRLERLQVPLVPMALPEESFDLTPALDALPTIQGVNLGSIAKLVAPMRKWFNGKRPWIMGNAYKSDSEVAVRLTHRSLDGTTNTVAATANKDLPNAGLIASESATYKMYYLISHPSTVSQAENAQRLRDGLNLLSQYVTGKDPSQLDAAFKSFRSIRNEDPTFDEAYLYEGIALDLLERHDEALTCFQYLAENADEEVLKLKARYNQAIALFRKYGYKELEEAITSLDEIIGIDALAASPIRESAGTAETLVGSPIKAFALAAKANAIAVRPIFWQRLLFNGTKVTGEEEIKERKRAKNDVVQEWVGDVDTITGLLEDVNKKAKGKSNWDALARRQLEWATKNAVGNINLDYGMYFFAPPFIEGQEPEKQKELLNTAYDAYRECEILLPPGVETLTNLATVLLELKKSAEARSYAKRAIELNPTYEYAYYRLAQSWEQEGRRDKVVEVLKSFLRAPKINEFQELYRMYYVEPPGL